MHTDLTASTRNDPPHSTQVHVLDDLRTSNCSSEDDGGISICRVCHCAEPDVRGDAALSFLDILPPLPELSDVDGRTDSSNKAADNVGAKEAPRIKGPKKEPAGFVEFISPGGEVFVCSNDLESGSFQQQDVLISLGCSCKDDLALAHYACALKWFVSHGSTACEICGSLAKNVRPSDFKKVMASLKEYEAMRERTMTGEPTRVRITSVVGIDPDAVAAIHRQRLSEVSLWFNPHINNFAAVSHEAAESSFGSNAAENAAPPPPRNAGSRWTLQSAGFVVAVGLLAVVSSWLIASHVGKKAAIVGLYVLLACDCGLTVVVVLRFLYSSSRLGSLRCWAALFVSGFLAFAVWARRTHVVRSSGS